MRDRYSRRERCANNDSVFWTFRATGKRRKWLLSAVAVAWLVGCEGGAAASASEQVLEDSASYARFKNAYCTLENLENIERKALLDFDFSSWRELWVAKEYCPEAAKFAQNIARLVVDSSVLYSSKAGLDRNQIVNFAYSVLYDATAACEKEDSDICSSELFGSLIVAAATVGESEAYNRFKLVGTVRFGQICLTSSQYDTLVRYELSVDIQRAIDLLDAASQCGIEPSVYRHYLEEVSSDDLGDARPALNGGDRSIRHALELAQISCASLFDRSKWGQAIDCYEGVLVQIEVVSDATYFEQQLFWDELNVDYALWRLSSISNNRTRVGTRSALSSRPPLRAHKSWGTGFGLPGAEYASGRAGSESRE